MGLGYCAGRSPESKSVTVLVPTLEAEEEKWCYDCKQYVSIKLFYLNGRRGTATDKCKACDNTYRHARRRKAFEVTGKWTGGMPE